MRYAGAMTDLPAVYVQYRLYLRQVEGNKASRVLEVVPVSFDYQGIIVVATERLPAPAGTVVVQSHSCGCGPQPLIRAGWLAGVVGWRQSEVRRLMMASASAKDRCLADQELVPEVWRVEVRDRHALAAVVQRHCGRRVAVRFFGEV